MTTRDIIINFYYHECTGSGSQLIPWMQGEKELTSEVSPHSISWARTHFIGRVPANPLGPGGEGSHQRGETLLRELK